MEDLESKQSLTEQEVNQVLNAFDFLEFSRGFSTSLQSLRKYGYYNPETINQQMQSITMNNISGTIEQMEKALASPKSSESVLRGYAESMELQSMYYKRLIRYFADMTSFNLNYDCINIEKDSDFKTKQYKNDLKVLDNFCSKFDFKNEFQTVLRQLLRQGVFYCVLRYSENKYTLQELPADFCLITGRHEYGLLFDFNMQWFFNDYGIDINMYPKVFKKMYNNINSRLSSSYNPHSNVETRNSTYMYWHQCSPSDGFWAWKLNPELTTVIPYFAPMFPDMGFQNVARKLQNNKYFLSAYKILVGVLGYNKNAKTGQVTNQFDITPSVLGQFLGVARKGLSDEIGLIALPVDDIKAVDFSVSDSNIVTDYIKNMAQQGLSSADVLMTDTKLNSHQSKLASAVDSNFVKSAYSMFADFVDYFVNQQTEKYKFHVSFHDIDIPDDRAERDNRFKNNAAMGIVDIQYAARVFDMNPFEFGRRLAMTKASNLESNLTPLMSLNNQSAKGSSGTNSSNLLGKVGRPSNPQSDNENTEASWARGSNELK